MPNVENLSKGFAMPTQAQPAPEQPVTPSTPVAGGGGSQLAVPPLFSQIATLPSAAHLPEPVSAATSYVFNASTRSSNYAQQQQAGLSDGDFALCLEGAVYKCDPLKYFLLQVSPYRTTMDQAGNITFATKNMDYVNSLQGEHYLSLILVFFKDRLIPAKGEFRTTKASAALEPLREIEAAGKPEWLKTDAHRVAAQFGIPWGRVVATSVPGGKKTSRSSGNAYIPAITNARPATLDEMKLLMEETGKPDFIELFNTVHDEYNQRKTFIDSRCR
jgi:hypothetical protein